MKTKMSESDKQYVWSRFRPDFIAFSFAIVINIVAVFFFFLDGKLPHVPIQPEVYMALVWIILVTASFGSRIFKSYRTYYNIMEFGNKITTETKIVDKQVAQVRKGKNSTRSTVYRIYFEDNVPMDYYAVNRTYYELIGIGETVEIAYTEQNEMVLKLQYLGKDIRFKWK